MTNLSSHQNLIWCGDLLLCCLGMMRNEEEVKCSKGTYDVLVVGPGDSTVDLGSILKSVFSRGASGSFQ